MKNTNMRALAPSNLTMNVSAKNNFKKSAI
jgi:hypothetical protein